MTSGDEATTAARNSILILGGGASGVILAAHLLRWQDRNLQVTIVERRAEFGRGHAYGTTLAEHTLNVRAGGMSAFADDPDHFRRWLEARGIAVGDADFFAPRGLYGDYLGSLLADLQAREPERLRLIRAEVERITPTAAGISVALANGASLVARRAVLALGHGDPQYSVRAPAIRFDGPEDTDLDPTGDVLVLGSGLSMVDAWLSLEQRGHRGKFIAVSRRGLLPLPHRHTSPVRLDSSDVPLGTGLSYFIRWFRDLIRATQIRGGSWRDVVDGLRPYNQRIWQSWSPGARRRFLEHTKAWWDIHRHRMSPKLHARVTEAVKAGRILLVAGRVRDIRASGTGHAVTIGVRGPSADITYEVARIYDCTGIVRSVAEGSNPALRSLLDRGHARTDAFGIGLDVTSLCAVVDAAGTPSPRLYAVGPLTRAEFFEIDAIPDIRVQCAALADRLAAPQTVS